MLPLEDYREVARKYWRSEASAAIIGLVDEVARLREVIRGIARIVENPDSRAPRQVRDITDKESMRSDSATAPEGEPE